MKNPDFVATAYIGDAAGCYDETRFVTKQGRLFANLELRELQRAISRVPKGASILEVGCGTARFSKYLGRQGYQVLATDPSADMIRIASAKCAGFGNIKFLQEDGANLSGADSTFDFVFSIRVTNQTESKEYALRMIKEMIRVTKWGGLILLEFVNSKRPFRRRSNSIRFSFDDMARVAHENNCRVEGQRGILVFSQTILNKVPAGLLPLWAAVEMVSAHMLWRWASRGYVLLRKI